MKGTYMQVVLPPLLDESWSRLIKLFTAVIYDCLSLTGLSDQVQSLPEWSTLQVSSSTVGTWSCQTNIRRGWKDLPETNTLT
jgi:hypothetical protein